MYGSNAPDLKFAKPAPRVTDARLKERARKKVWRDVTKEVKTRDGGKCRCCGKRGDHVHHLIYRSHGGANVAGNLILLCAKCHQDAHAKLILVKWSGKTPANNVKFERISK